jgi:hypothetical protein
MERSQLSRDFSARVQTNFHKQGDPFRFRMWMVSLGIALVALAWLLWNGVNGRNEIYTAGPVSTPHHMFENRCEVCHDKFSGPIERLVSFGLDRKATSAPDQKCLACHDGARHFFTGSPDLSYHERHQQANLVVEGKPPGHHQHCAECHREHDTTQELRRISSKFCTECHSNLKNSPTDSGQLDSLTFQHAGATGIADFAHHPEFAVHEATDSDSPHPDPPKSHGVHLVVSEFIRKGETESRWQDRAAIRFNHARHLKPRDPRGLPDARGDFHILSDDCSSCHRPDAERRYMEPVNYEMHCSSCHPLVFDADRVQASDGRLFRIDWDSNGTGRSQLINELDPDDVHDADVLKDQKSPFKLLVAPHDRPEHVRGFLTDVYSRKLLGELRTSQQEKKTHSIVRPFPGQTTDALAAPVLNPDDLDQVDRNVDLAESLVRSQKFAASAAEEIPGLFRTLHWLQGSGGCGFCHESSQDAEGHWTITDPNIPKRWFQHAAFNHDSHRGLKCTECHTISGKTATLQTDTNETSQVHQSSSTGDILMPKISLCKTCHTASLPKARGHHGARADCLECHKYHQRDFEKQGSADLKKFLTGVPEAALAE